MTSKTEKVKTLFEAPEKYLGQGITTLEVERRLSRVNKHADVDHALDIGCGDGFIFCRCYPAATG